MGDNLDQAKADRLGATLSLDGSQWCALIGPNIQEGECGFGDTEQIALLELEVNLLNNRVAEQSDALMTIAGLLADQDRKSKLKDARRTKEIKDLQEMLRLARRR